MIYITTLYIYSTQSTVKYTRKYVYLCAYLLSPIQQTLTQVVTYNRTFLLLLDFISPFGLFFYVYFSFLLLHYFFLLCASRYLKQIPYECNIILVNLLSLYLTKILKQQQNQVIE